MRRNLDANDVHSAHCSGSCFYGESKEKERICMNRHLTPPNDVRFQTSASSSALLNAVPAKRLLPVTKPLAFGLRFSKLLAPASKNLLLRARKTTLNAHAMKTAALRFKTLAAGLVLTGSFITTLKAVDAYTDPVGYYTLGITGASDNVMSLPMVRDAVFAGVADNGTTPFTENSFTALAGTASPGWTANQFAYVAATQPQTYYVEFTSGALKGLYYKIVSNTANSVTLDMEGDSLLSHSLPGNPTAALADGDSFKIRPYWRVKDVFEVGGTPIIEGRSTVQDVKDDILIPNNSVVGINKAAEKTIYFLTGQGWRSENDANDYANFVLRPNESFIVRRRNAANVNLTNLGGVLMNKQIAFVPGGDATTANDVYISLNRPAAVSLNDSGIANVMTPSPAPYRKQDLLMVFPTGAGFDRTPSTIYYFLAGQPAGQGWRKAGDDANATTGQTTMIEPGKTYLIRKRAGTQGKDWVNDPNY
jgi:uncharacterized protein (TIGR02597 family)